MTAGGSQSRPPLRPQAGETAASTKNKSSCPTGWLFFILGMGFAQAGIEGERWERCQWQVKRPERVAAVKGSHVAALSATLSNLPGSPQNDCFVGYNRKPEGCFGHRNRNR